jgi:hypothetical protein
MLQPLSSSPTASAPRERAARRHGRGLALLTLAVALVHWGLLYGLPLAVAAYQGRDASMVVATEQPFITRTLVADAPQPTPQTVQPTVQNVKKEQKATRIQRFTAPVSDDKFTQNIPAAPVDTAQVATKNIATQDVQIAAANLVPAAAPTAARLPDAQALQHYALPGSVRLKYDVKVEYKGIPFTVSGELLWQQDGKAYDARMEVSLGLMGSIVQTSKGQLGAQGLEPTRFGDKRRSEVAAHFERSKGTVVFSANTPDATLLPGAQDQLSVFMQLASMVGGAPNRFPEGVQIPFQAVGPRSSESWTFVVGGLETLALPGGTIKALKLSRPPANEYSPRAEIWLAPELGYMPARIRLTEANGDIVDQQWSSTQKP